MTARRLNAWARAVHMYCTANGVGVTIAEAVAACGKPPPGASPVEDLMDRARAKGFFASTKVRRKDGRRGHWFTAVYTAVGPTPLPLLAETPEFIAKRKRATNSYFNGVKRATSIFDFAEQCNSETTK